MSDLEVTTLIRAKLGDGRLPQNSIPRVWGGAGKGERCDACDLPVAAEQFIMEGIGDAKRSWQFHVACFYVWDSERTPPGRPARTRAPLGPCAACQAPIDWRERPTEVNGVSYHGACLDEVLRRGRDPALGPVARPPSRER